MNAKADLNDNNRTGNVDVYKWLLALSIMAGGFYSFHYFSQYQVAYRILGLVPLVIAALWVASSTEKGSAIALLIKESGVEVRKVVWPTRQETIQTTMVVIGFVVITALVLWGLDAAFAKFLSLVMA